MNYSMIEEVDTQCIYKVYENWPQLTEKAFNRYLEFVNFENSVPTPIAKNTTSGMNL